MRGEFLGWIAGWQWHLTSRKWPYTYAPSTSLALDLEQTFRITIGICFWWPVIVLGARRMGVGSGGVSTCWARSSALLFPRPRLALHPVGSSTRIAVHAPRLWGISPVHDQNLGGELMTAEQSAVFLAAVAFTLRCWTRRSGGLTDMRRWRRRPVPAGGRGRVDIWADRDVPAFGDHVPGNCTRSPSCFLIAPRGVRPGAFARTRRLVAGGRAGMRARRSSRPASP